MGPPASLFKLSSNLLACPSSSQQGMVLPPPRAHGMSGDVCGCHTGGTPGIVNGGLTPHSAQDRFSQRRTVHRKCPQCKMRCLLSLSLWQAQLAPWLLSYSSSPFLSSNPPVCTPQVLFLTASFIKPLAPCDPLGPAPASGLNCLAWLSQVLSYLLFMKALQHCAGCNF